MVATKVSGDGNKIHTANCNSGESNVSSLRIGEATKWKKTSTNDIASKPLVKIDSFKVSMSMKVANSKGPMAGLNPVEEVDCFHSNKRIGTHHSLETHRGEK